MSHITVRCMVCGEHFPGDRPLTSCPACGGLLDVEIRLDRRLQSCDFGQHVPESAAHSGVWRYWPLLPQLPAEAIVSRWEGNTPLYRDDRLAQYAGLTDGAVGFKHEGLNPTASFKDRGMTVGVSHARAVGARIVACASTGNTSASLAAYAAAAGIPSLVLVPATNVAMGKLAQTIAYGARSCRSTATSTPRWRCCERPTAAYGVYLVNSVNPFRLEGQKTIVFETAGAARLAGRPTGSSCPAATWATPPRSARPWSRRCALGLIDRMPRLAVIQAAGAAPFAAYFQTGFERVRAGARRDGRYRDQDRRPGLVRHAPGASIEITDGRVTTVDATRRSWRPRRRSTAPGIGCEPASAASLAGLRKLVGEGVVRPGETAVCLLTGHLLKDTEAVAAYHFGDDAPARRARAPTVPSASPPSYPRWSAYWPMRFTVRTPASSANLGPGFDALGLALDLWNEATIDSTAASEGVTLLGEEALLLDGRENLVLTAMRRLADETGRKLPPFSLSVRTEVPVARGLGSSAAALVAGLIAADYLLGTALPPSELFSLAWQMEGHGDNVGATLYGGAVLAVPEVSEPIQLLTHGRLDLCAVVFIPRETGLTRAARAALPPTVPHTDAAFNVATVGGLVLGLHTGDPRLIKAGMHDRLHEPYRARLFLHLEAMTAAARAAGALGACLSGAGPSVLALVEPRDAEPVAQAYRAAAVAAGVAGEVRRLTIATGGAEVSDLQGNFWRPAHRSHPPVGQQTG